MCINVLEPLFSSYRLCWVIEIELNNELKLDLIKLH